MDNSIISISYMKRMIRDHFSFVLIALGSGTIFLCNILFKTLLSETDYGEYSILITFIATVFNLGLLGLDKVLMRVTTIKNKRIYLDKKFPWAIGLTILVVCIIGTYIFNKQFFVGSNSFIKILIVALSAVLSMISYNFYRLKSEFVKAQMISNIWKFGLLLLAFVFYLWEFHEFTLLFNAVFVLCTVILITTVILLFKTSFSYGNTIENKDFIKFWIGFGVSISVLIGITFFDRYYIKEIFGAATFGNYFYLANIFLFPFHLLQNYVGFKKLVFFKENFSRTILLKQTQNLFFQSILLSIVLCAVAYLANFLQLIEVDFKSEIWLILSFLFLGMIKVFFGLFESALSARVHIRLINQTNIVSLIIVGLVLIITISFIETVLDVAILTCAMWLSLVLVYLGASLKLNQENLKKDQ
jgi:O-antigen/teichoic acid export membrane protein